MEFWEFDTNADGFVDQHAYDLDMSGTADVWHIDSVGDGYFDQIGMDTRGDGMADVWFADPNLDGWADTVWQDTVGDGVPDTWQHAPAGTSMGWEHFAEPQDPWGGETVVGGQGGEDWTILDPYGNPVNAEDILPDTATVEPTPTTGLDQMFVQARESGSLWDQIMIWNMIQDQNAMIYDGLSM